MKRISAVLLVGAARLCAQGPAIGPVINAASLGPELSPGAAAVVQGAGFTAGAVLNLGDTKVEPVAGSVLPTRFNVLLPAALAPGAYQATVTTAAGTSAARTLVLAAASPAFYSVTQDGTAVGVFFSDTFTRLTAENGAIHGTVITAYANGLGPAQGSNPVSSATLPLRVAIRGENGWQSVAATAQQESSTPGYWLVRFTMPEGLPQGMHDAYLTAGTTDSPIVQLPVGGAIIGAVVNAASNAKGAAVAPGSMLSIYGTNLAPADRAGLFPATQLPGGGEIRIAGTAAPLYDVSATFGVAHAIVPWEAPASGTVDVVVINALGISRPFPLKMAETAVGIFRLQDPSTARRFNAAALIQGTPWVAMPLAMAVALGIPQDCRARGVDANAVCGQPASAGDVLQIYVTGLGKVVASGDPPGPALATGRAAPADGSILYRSAAVPQVTIGGAPAAVLFAGLAPGFAGLYQIDAVVPMGVTPGDDVPVTIAMPAGDRDTATIAVR